MSPFTIFIPPCHSGYITSEALLASVQKFPGERTRAL